jgi:pimeloyl-ACP methyl ester carboxylesterase
MNPERRARLAANDAAALIAASLDRPDHANMLPTMRMPCVLLIGALDPFCPNVQKAAETLPNAELVVLPYCDHGAIFGRTDLNLPPVTAFLARVAGPTKAD